MRPTGVVSVLTDFQKEAAEVVNLVIVEHRKRGGEGEGTTFVPSTHSYWGFGVGLARQSY